MKCGTFSCKRTLLKKDLTRFAPFWGGYLLCLLMGLMLIGGEGAENLAVNLTQLPELMAFINCGYALLTAQLLFGDLYNTRMCSGFHALPIRREGIFGIQVLAGLLFSLLPTAAMALLSLPLIQSAPVAGAWQIPLWWWLGVNLQYLFFFGLGVFCALGAGNRLGMALLYGMTNLAAAGAAFLVDVYYTPMLFGVVTPSETILKFCPLVGMVGSNLMLQTWSGADGTLTLGDGWGYLGICAGVGAALLILGLILYKKRHLEKAGDLLAADFWKPVFLVGLSLGTAALMVVFVSNYDAMRSRHYVLTAIGLAVGWFVGRMLLEKKLRVFDRKGFAGLAALAAVLGLSLLLTGMDVFGISTWIPKPEQVESAQLGLYGWGRESGDESHVKSVIRFQELALEAHLEPREDWTEDTPRAMLRYHLKDGRQVGREYWIPMDSEGADILRKVSSSPEALLGEELLALDWGRQIDLVAFHSWNSSMALPDRFRTEGDLNSLKAAILADCAAGTMAPYDGFHETPVFSTLEKPLKAAPGEIPTVESQGHVEYCWSLVLEGDGIYRHLSVYSDSENTLRWMSERGILEQLEQETREYLKEIELSQK